MLLLTKLTLTSKNVPCHLVSKLFGSNSTVDFSVLISKVNSKNSEFTVHDFLVIANCLYGKSKIVEFGLNCAMAVATNQTKNALKYSGSQLLEFVNGVSVTASNPTWAAVWASCNLVEFSKITNPCMYAITNCHVDFSSRACCAAQNVKGFNIVSQLLWLFK